VSAPVAVAVVSWNTRELLAGCLRSLAPEADAGRAEVWVVDNASSDGSPELVRDEFPWAQLVASDENLGFGRAVNAVAERTESDWIAPANADAKPSSMRLPRSRSERLPKTSSQSRS
jgi:N-acetylglucosaminyl-diphospho-decaprenol L-rhamnosyltransferase